MADPNDQKKDPQEAQARPAESRPEPEKDERESAIERGHAFVKNIARENPDMTLAQAEEEARRQDGDDPQLNLSAIEGELTAALTTAKQNGMEFGNIQSALGAIGQYNSARATGGGGMLASAVLQQIGAARQEVDAANAKEVQNVQQAVGNLVAVTVALSAPVMAGTAALLATSATDSPDGKEQEEDKKAREKAVKALAALGLNVGPESSAVALLGAGIRGFERGVDALNDALVAKKSDPVKEKDQGLVADRGELSNLIAGNALSAEVTRGPSAGRAAGIS